MESLFSLRLCGLLGDCLGLPVLFEDGLIDVILTVPKGSVQSIDSQFQSVLINGLCDPLEGRGLIAVLIGKGVEMRIIDIDGERISSFRGLLLDGPDVVV